MLVMFMTPVSTSDLDPRIFEASAALKCATGKLLVQKPSIERLADTANVCNWGMLLLRLNKAEQRSSMLLLQIAFVRV